MLWWLSVTSVSSMAPGPCSVLKHYTLHLHPLHPRQVPQYQEIEMETVMVKV